VEPSAGRWRATSERAPDRAGGQSPLACFAVRDPLADDPLAGVSPPLATALVARFLLELALLAGAAALAWYVASGGWRWPAAIAAAGVVATVWGLLLSPRATIAIPPAARLALEALLFVGIGVGLTATGSGVVAAIGVALWAVDRAAIAALSGRAPRT
jgi:hypothetical protein